MAEPVIREARASDFEAWLPLWRGYNAFYGRPDFPEAITRTTWARFLDPSEPMHALVADDGGRLCDKLATNSGFVVYRIEF